MTLGSRILPRAALPFARLGLVLVALASATLAASAGALANRPYLDTRLFTRVGQPGYPEPVAIGPDGLIYVGTNQPVVAAIGATPPSRIFAFDRAGRLVRTEVVKGQPLDSPHGIQSLVFDGSGLLYALDRSRARPRVIVIDAATGAQRDYATFPVPAGPDYAAFAPDGRLYVTDIDEGLIWRIPRGGGRARVWFRDPLLESPFGPNGLQFRADGRTLVFAVTISAAAEDRSAGLLLDLPVRRDGRPGELRRLWTSRPADGPDGFALARSGRIYVALSIGNALAVVSPDGSEVARFPATPEANAGLAVPFDGPASLAFLGRRLLVTNQSPLKSNPASWALFDVWAGEAGVPLFHPVVAPAARRPRIKLSVTPRSVPSRTRRRLTFLATVGRGTRRRAIAGAKIAFAGRTLRTNRKGRATLRVALTEPRVVRALATATGLRAGQAVVRVFPAPRLPR